MTTQIDHRNDPSTGSNACSPESTQAEAIPVMPAHQLVDAANLSNACLQDQPYRFAGTTANRRARLRNAVLPEEEFLDATPQLICPWMPSAADVFLDAGRAPEGHIAGQDGEGV